VQRLRGGLQVGAPESRRHPLTAALARTAGRLGVGDLAFLDLTDRRLAALAHLARGLSVDSRALGLSRADRARARRALLRREAAWSDGDENLVRGRLGEWTESTDDPPRTLARRLVDTAAFLARVSAREETLWFFLWEMESMLPDLAAPRPAAPRRAGRRK
jgi:hypothetical protein